MVKLAKRQSRCQTSALRHLLWAAMEKIGKKELDSKLLDDGTSHTVSMQIEGTIDEPDTVGSTARVCREWHAGIEPVTGRRS